MPFTFGGLGIAGSALRAQQLLMDIIDHNVTNANTPGFSRQTGLLAATRPFTSPASNMPAFPLQFGTGVGLEQITRFRLESLEETFRREQQNLGIFESSGTILKQVESAFGEPGASGLNAIMNDFFASWQSLAGAPDDLTRRNNVLLAANQLVKTIQGLTSKLNTIIQEANTDVQNKVTEINDIAKKIADLNKEIRLVRGAGQNANDLMDERDRLLGDLSKLINIQVVKKPDGSAFVYIGGRYLISDDVVKPLEAFQDTVAGPPGSGYFGDGRIRVRFQGDTSPTPALQLNLDLTRGDLYGIINTRDTIIGSTTAPAGPTPPPGIYFQLNQLVTNLITTVNQRHSLGYNNNTPPGTGLPFFSGTDITNIGVAITDPRNIAAAVASLTSTLNMNNQFRTVDPNKTLSQAVIDNDYAVAPPAPGAYSFVIDTDPLDALPGVSISYTVGATPTTGDTLNSIIASINNSNAGVIASFDPVSQKILLKRDTRENPGAGFSNGPTISITDTTGNFTAFTFLATAVPTTGAPGDNTNATFMADLLTETLPALSGASFATFYGQIVSRVGKEVSDSSRQEDAENLVIQQLNKQRESFSGVSLDEEALNLIRAQQAYNAAARTVTALDEMLDKLINGTGRVGL